MNVCHRIARSRGLCAIGLLLAATGASAGEPSQALDRVSIWLGGYYLDTDVKVSASDASGDISTGKVDLTSGHETVGRARIDFLFLGSQGFTLDYYTLSHATSQTLSTPFTYEGIPFELNTRLRGNLDFTAGSAAYHWWFGSKTDVFGIGLGATYYKAKLGISGTAELDGQSSNASVRWDENAIAPLVTLGYKHAFSDQFRVYINASGVKKNGGSLSGHIYDGRVGMEWFPWHNVGVGAEYGYTRVKLNHDGDTYDAKLDIKLDGPSLFARFRF